MNPADVHDQWASRSGEYSPQYYAYYGPDERSERVREVFDRVLERDASILELGCSSGRHLAHLYDAGFEDLSGIDLNDEAFEVMAEAYPELAEAGTFHVGSIEEIVSEFETDRFDAVYSVETLQHLHPDSEWVLEELCRITADLLVTVENEGDIEDDAQDDVGDDAQGDLNADVENDVENGSGTNAAPEVNYVDEDFPLYYRDWNREFTELGLTQIEVRSGDRDVLRAFRVE
ncbi:class I SAM-dependent methyltransferase [Halopenitus salinus]|uniref:Class I SAM-dependent methyltransferase n=1 Tax=Halopenitus salinus TaxID=1198295 RepID=A0ABD5UV13_9EURY